MSRLTFIILFISSISFAQVEKSVGDFNKVTVFDKITVTLIASDENKIVLNGNEADQVELINKNSELKIRMPLTKIMTGDNISATVYYTNLDAVEANEGSRIESNETLNATQFNVIAKEGAQIQLDIKAVKLALKALSGAIVDLKGEAKNQEINISSGAVYNGQNLKSNQTTITVTAGGEATIYATELVDAKVRAGGEILIYGKPNQINQKTIAGGTIKEVN